MRHLKRFREKARNSRRTVNSCETCANLIPIGEGDHICDADPLRIPLCEYKHTEDYFWCGGSQYISN